MKQEAKELLLKDLCGRLPYGVKCLYFDAEGNKRIDLLNAVFPNDGRILVGKCSIDYADSDIIGVIPYLFPLSSINEGQRDLFTKECGVTISTFYSDGNRIIQEVHSFKAVDWLNEHHFDYRGLIEKSLALDATNLGIYE